MEEAVVAADGDDVGVLLLAAAANNGHHGECLWKSASRALIRKEVSRQTLIVCNDLVFQDVKFQTRVCVIGI